MAFSPDYVRLVLQENFEDAKTLFLEPLLAIHRAHLVMLAEQGIIPIEDARVIRNALAAVDVDALRRARYDPATEDLFFFVNRLLAESCGAARAGRLHTARSRNDIDMTMYRMRLRGFVQEIADEVIALRLALLTLAASHTETVFAAHTHVQPAQPTTVAHYILALVEQLERDSIRLAAAYETTNRNPLGACAITGTGFPIDRFRTSDLLGFSAPTGNTYGSIATVDYLLESAAATATLIVGIGRFVQDMLLWSTIEVGYLRLPDEFVQASSIMPQKRNPVSLEHARALGSKAAGQLAAIPAAVHNTPFGDIVDTEDDLQPLVASAFRDASRTVSLVRVTMARAEFDIERMARRAGQGWVTVTELADTLVRTEGWSFEQTHGLAAQLARSPQPASGREAADTLRQLALASGLHMTTPEGAIVRALDPRAFVEVRRTPGGPAPSVTTAAIAESVARAEEGRRRAESARRRLDAANLQLDQAFLGL